MRWLLVGGGGLVAIVIVAAVVVTAVGAAWRERARHGGVAYVMTHATAPVRLTTTITDMSLPYGGSWELAITPDGDGARLVVTEYGVVRSPLFRIASRFVLGHTATLDAYLSALGRHYGVAIAPEDAPAVPRAASATADVAPLEVPHGT